MNIKVKISLLLIMVMGISCEDYLREEPPTFISASNFWKTASDARTGVNGVYQKLNDAHNRWWVVVDLFTDDIVSRTNGGNYFNPFGEHTVTASTPVFEQFGLYSDWWIGIGRANTVLKFVPSITMDDTEKNKVLGEARALRALYYFNLVRAFGDVPMMTDVVTTEADFNKPRVSPEIIYDEVIIPDLKFAEEFCRDGLHDGHITKWTAKLILADVYMTRAGWRRTSQGELVQGDAANWALARDKAKEIIDNSPHTLNTVAKVNGKNITPAYGVAWLDDNPFTPESMLELSYVQVAGLGNWMSRESNPNSTASGYWGANANAQPLLGEGIPGNLRAESPSNPDGLFFKGSPPSQGQEIPTPDLYDAFEAGDKRRDFSLMTRYITPSGRNYLCQPTFRKFIDIAYYLGEEGTSFQYTTSNLILYRFADALLIYAEAQNEADGTPNAAAYTAINRIRRRAFEVTDSSRDLAGLSQDAFRKAIWKERRVELNAEFKRKFDLIRTNQLVTETTNINLNWTAAQGSKSNYVNCYTPFYSTRPAWPDREWLWPIPQSEFDLNKKNGWIQNKGY
jgi:starch-binding outer membrane protein, SusD/RagB family